MYLESLDVIFSDLPVGKRFSFLACMPNKVYDHFHIDILEDFWVPDNKWDIPIQEIIVSDSFYNTNHATDEQVLNLYKNHWYGFIFVKRV